MSPNWETDFLKANSWFLLVRWSVMKQTFLGCSALFLTGQFSACENSRLSLLLGATDVGETSASASRTFHLIAQFLHT